MALHLQYDSVDLSPSPLVNFGEFSAGSHVAAHNSEIGERCRRVCSSRAGVMLLAGSVMAGPTRPPVAAIEHLLLAEVGEAAFEDGMKRYIGRVVRFVIEQLGGEHHSYGSNVSVTSFFNKGSTYRFRDWHPHHQA